MKFLVPNYSCLPEPLTRGGYRPQIPILSILSPQLNLLNPPHEKKIPGYATESNGSPTFMACYGKPLPLRRHLAAIERISASLSARDIRHCAQIHCV